MSTADVDAHLERFPGAQAVALRKTRDLIAKTLPGAEQVISYAMPTFKIDGRPVVGIEGFKAHNSLFPYSPGVVAMIESEQPEWVAAKGTIRFPIDQPLPAPLLKRVIALRIEEINAGFPKPNGQAREFYSNGVLKLKGRYDADGQMHGNWEWFRRDGSLMRTGGFRNGAQVGEWVTYDRTGAVVKRTRYPVPS